MTPTQNLRAISERELAILAVENVAYVKPVEVDGHAAYAIHAADGTQLGLAAERDAAFAAVLQNDLTPVSVH
jgi:hypothetical protein